MTQLQPSIFTATPVSSSPTRPLPGDAERDVVLGLEDDAGVFAIEFRCTVCSKPSAYAGRVSCVPLSLLLRPREDTAAAFPCALVTNGTGRGELDVAPCLGCRGCPDRRKVCETAGERLPGDALLDDCRTCGVPCLPVGVVARGFTCGTECLCNLQFPCSSQHASRDTCGVVSEPGLDEPGLDEALLLLEVLRLRMGLASMGFCELRDVDREGFAHLGSTRETWLRRGGCTRMRVSSTGVLRARPWSSQHSSPDVFTSADSGARRFRLPPPRRVWHGGVAGGFIRGLPESNGVPQFLEGAAGLETCGVPGAFCHVGNIWVVC